MLDRHPSLRAFDIREEAEAYAQGIRDSNGGLVTVVENFLGKCRGCRGHGWLGPEALFRCRGCAEAGREPLPLTRSEAAWERALEAAEGAMKARNYLGDDLVDTSAMLAWFLDPRRTLWERL